MPRVVHCNNSIHTTTARLLLLHGIPHFSLTVILHLLLPQELHRSLFGDKTDPQYSAYLKTQYHNDYINGHLFSGMIFSFKHAIL